MSEDKSISKEPRPANAGNLLADLKGNLSDREVAKLFIANHGIDLRFIAKWNRWAVWDGEIWEVETVPKAYLKAKAILLRFIDRLYVDGMVMVGLQKSIKDENEIIKFVRSIQNGKRPDSILEFCKSLPGILAEPEEFNANPHLIQCENAVIDLSSTHMTPNQVPSLDRHDPRVPEYLFNREHMITQRASVKYFEGKPEVQAWIDHLELIFDGDQELIDYMQKLCGYFLAGLTDECIMAFAFGDGANGKSVFWNTINGILGDYSGIASSEIIMPAKDSNMRLQAELYGKRAVFVGEPRHGRKIDDGKLKELTGDDTIVCARLYENPWEFKPTHTFFCSTNHKPIINTTDNGIWRRIKLIPFTVNIGEALKDKGGADPKFMDKLKEQWPGIFKWCIEGFRKYRKEGLKDCKAIIEATKEYRGEEDLFKSWVDESLIPAEGNEISITDAHKLCLESGARITRSAFKRKMLTLKGVEYKKGTKDPNKGRWVFTGIGEPKEDF